MIVISIIIPIYNANKYLRECLDSVINQTLRDIEIICVNDGSTDNSLDIINEYAKKDNRIIIVNKKNAGMGAAYNSGLDIAKGEYIGFVEPDDYISLKMYEKLYELTEFKPDIVKSSAYSVENNNIKNLNMYGYLKNFDKENIFKAVILGMVSHWSAIYKKDFLDKFDIKFLETPGATFQDTAFAKIAYFCADRIELTNEPFYYYRIHSNQSMSALNKKTTDFRLYQLEKIMEYGQKCVKTFPKKKLEILAKSIANVMFFECSRISKNKYLGGVFRMKRLLNSEFMKNYQNKNNFPFEQKILYDLIEKSAVQAYLYLNFNKIFIGLRRFLLLLKMV